MNISVITNITIEPFFSKKLKELFGDNENLFIHIIAYEEYANSLKQIEDSEFVIIWINIEILLPDINVQINDIIKFNNMIEIIIKAYDTMINLFNKIGEKKVIIINQENGDNKNKIFKGHVVNKFDIVRTINGKLIDSYIEKNIVIIDLNEILISLGAKAAYDKVNKYRWNAVYSNALIENVSYEIYKQVLIYKGITKKCIVLDCDNVLWGGILSEDGIENIQLSNTGEGKVYQDFQRFILNLYYHGIIIAISSKNDLNDILDVFDKHSDMILKKKHISCFQVNWESKADNILNIAAYLNIDVNSMIFVDDSIFEINLVQRLIPGITTVLFEKNDDIYSHFNCINLNSITDNGMANIRAQTYQQNLQRNSLRDNAETYDDYLKSLNTQIEIHRADETELKRISELSLRTNQCTNGIRFFSNKLSEIFKNDEFNIYAIYVEDVFGKLGLVGAIIVKQKIILLFCLSCRALGRNVENVMLEFVNKNYSIENVVCKKTSKNNKIVEKFSSLWNVTIE